MGPEGARTGPVVMGKPEVIILPLTTFHEALRQWDWLSGMGPGSMDCSLRRPRWGGQCSVSVLRVSAPHLGRSESQEAGCGGSTSSLHASLSFFFLTSTPAA